MLSRQTSKFVSSKVIPSTAAVSIAVPSSLLSHMTRRRNFAQSSSASSTSLVGLFSRTSTLLDSKTNNNSINPDEIEEFDEEANKQRNESEDELSTNVEDEEDEQNFDVVEATLQEVHDLVVAMLAHKKNSGWEQETREKFLVERYKMDDSEYRSFRDWESGHKLFTEWIDKLEQLLTKDIMKAMIRNAEALERHPSQKISAKTDLNEVTSNPENYTGFAKHPLSYSSATGPEFKTESRWSAPNQFNCGRELTSREVRTGQQVNSSEVHRLKKRMMKDTTRFFTHGPYQIQISRPDASPELMEQARCARDRNSVACLLKLTEERTHWVRQLPTKDRLRMIKMISEILISVDEDAEVEEFKNEKNVVV